MTREEAAQAHPSSLVLDEIATGLEAASEAVAHAGACPVCGPTVELRRAALETLRDEVGYRRTLARLEAQPPRTPWWRLPAVLTTGVALAAVVWFLLPPARLKPSDAFGLKGAPSLELIDRKGAALNAPARVGAHVALKLSASGAREALILAIDERGQATQLWPASGDESAPVPGKGVVVLSPEFAVSPGALTLVALFSEQPLPAAAALAAFAGGAQRLPAVADLMARPKLAGEQARAFAVLCVEGSPCPSLR